MNFSACIATCFHLLFSFSIVALLKNLSDTVKTVKHVSTTPYFQRTGLAEGT